MDPWHNIVGAVLAVFAVIAIGAIARHVNWLTEQADQSLLKLVINLLMPALILSVILGRHHLLDTRNLLFSPLVGFTTVMAGFAAAAIAARSFGKAIGLTDARMRGTFALCVGLYNYSYIPLPLASQLPGFGPDTVAILFIHNLGVEIAMWTVGVILVSGHLGGHWCKRILNAPTIAIAAALVLNFLGASAHIPAAVHTALDMLGRSAIPVALLLVGATVTDQLRGAQILRGIRTIGFACLLRLGLLPASFLLLAWLLPASRELKQVIILQAAMPSAVFPVVLARHYGGHPVTAIRVVLGTSVLSLATMPLWLAAGLWLLSL